MPISRFSWLSSQAKSASAAGLSRNQWIRDIRAAGVKGRRQDLLSFASDFWGAERKRSNVRNIRKGFNIQRASYNEPINQKLHKRFVYNVGFDIKNNTTGRTDTFYQNIGSDNILDTGQITDQGFAAVFGSLDKSQIEIRNLWVEDALHRPGDPW